MFTMTMKRWATLATVLCAAACSAAAPEGPTSDEPVDGVENEASQFCGGIAAFPCPDGYVCVDDPRDDCDPNKGGADCGGICRHAKPSKCNYGDPTKKYISKDPVQCQTIKFYCDPGYEPFFDKCGCGCQQTQVMCGTKLCPAGEVCCNASCSICTPPDGVCIQMVCEPAPTL